MAGDQALGYDLTNAHFNLSEEDDARLNALQPPLPDVVLVRKCYASRGERAWRLKTLDKDETRGGAEKPSAGKDDEDEQELEEFMQQIEADKEFRQQMNLYKRKGAVKSHKSTENSSKMKVNDAENSDEEHAYDDEELRLEELLEDMSLNSDLEEENDDDNVATGRERQEFLILSENEAQAVTALDLPLETTHDNDDSSL